MSVFTVGQVTQYLKVSLEQDPLLADLWISGEVSNLRIAPSGHSYFTLKDSESQIRSVMFKGSKGAHLLVDGTLVSAHGRISFYQTRGDVQLVADVAMPEGTGQLALELERLKVRLEGEGLFEMSRKRSLVPFPKVIGVVTSLGSAALDDIRNVIGRRYPLVEVLFAHTSVQGDVAAPEIVSAIHAINEDGRADVIILARGGGSIEELWPFNEEIVARAVYSSRIPIISAVGHERDFTISDYVADVRAPTPSAAAELVVPNMVTLSEEVHGYQEVMIRSMSRYILNRTQEVGDLVRRLQLRIPDTSTVRRQVDDLARMASIALFHSLSLRRSDVNSLQMRVGVLDPTSVLDRGYAVVQKTSDLGVVSKRNQVRIGDAVKVTLSDGPFHAVVGTSDRKRGKQKTMVRAGERLL